MKLIELPHLDVNLALSVLFDISLNHLELDPLTCYREQKKNKLGGPGETLHLYLSPPSVSLFDIFSNFPKLYFLRNNFQHHYQ